MSVEQSPAFQFYPRDFLSDERVLVMGATARGAYITLLCVCWIEGSLPTSDDHLSRLANCPLREWNRIKSDVVSCFYEQDGRYYQKRLEIERKKQSDWKAGLSEAGREGAARRWRGHSQAIASPEAGHALANGESMPLQSSSSSSSSNTPTACVAPIASGPHRSHAFCSIACVPSFLHQEFRAGLNREDQDAADAELRAGYLAHVNAWPKGKPTGDAIAFWRAWYREKYAPPVPVFGKGKTAGNQKALEQFLEMNRRQANGVE